MKKFVYSERKADALIQRGQGGGDFDTYLKRGVQMYKPKVGKHKIRILPPTWDNNNHYGLDIWVNYGVGPDKGSYLSLNKMKNSKDPIYEEYIKARNEGREEDAKNLAARKRILVYVIDRKAEDQGPLLWPMPITFDKSLCQLAVDQDSQEILRIDHPDEGFDVTYTKSGEGQFTKYEAVSISRNPSPLSDDEDTANAWLDFVMDNPVPEQLNYYSYDHIKRAFTGIVEAPLEEETPRVRTAAKPVVADMDDEIPDHPVRKLVSEVKEDVEEDEVKVDATPAKTGLAARLAARGRNRG
jgi:hypothetical protein